MNSGQFKKGHIPWSQGKPLPKKTKEKISLAKKGFKHSEKTRNKMSENNKGDRNPFYDRSHSNATKEKISKMNKGHNHPMWGKHHSKKTKKKMSMIAKGRILPKKHRKRLSNSHKNIHDKEKNINWKGGIKKHQMGYIYILSSEHPFCTKDGYVFEHRLIIEKQIGRLLNPKEACHHINKIKDDNRPENLMAFSSHSSHRIFENGKNQIIDSDIIFDGRLL